MSFFVCIAKYLSFISFKYLWIWNSGKFQVGSKGSWTGGSIWKMISSLRCLASWCFLIFICLSLFPHGVWSSESLHVIWASHQQGGCRIMTFFHMMAGSQKGRGGNYQARKELLLEVAQYHSYHIKVHTAFAQIQESIRILSSFWWEVLMTRMHCWKADRVKENVVAIFRKYSHSQ